MLNFDIETGPEEESILKKRYKPFDKSSVEHPGTFDPVSVKYGNTKDEAKRSQKLEEERAKHADAVKNFDRKVEKAAAEHWDNYVKKAALHPATGRLLAFGGIKEPDNPAMIHLAEYPNERDFLTSAWKAIIHHKAASKVGWNIHGFDLPFLVLRSAFLDVAVPSWVRVIRGDKIFFDPSFVDLLKVWDYPRLHNPFGDNKLNTVAGVLGCGSKDVCECDGEHFHEFYFGGEEKRAKALSYLANDLVMTWNVANVLQVV